MSSTTLILGGGFGGIVAANTLRTALHREHRIVLIDRSPTFRVGATKTWIVVDHPGSRQMDYRRDKLRESGIELIEDTVARIDPKSREIQLKAGGTLRGDAVIVALGADYDLGAVPGLVETAQTFYTVEGAIRLRDALADFKGGKIVFLTPRTPFKCPPAPYEGAMMIHDLLKRKGSLTNSQLKLITAEGAPMATAGPEMGRFVVSLLEERGIAFVPSKKTVRVDPGAKRIVFEDGEEAFDLLIATPPHVAPAVVREAGLTGPSGWIPVDSKTLEVAGFEGVYAIGDVTVLTLPGRFKPDVPLVMPKAGVAAEAQGRVVAARIAAKLLGSKTEAVFDGKAFCFLETGDMHAVKGNGDFFAMPHPVMEKAVPDMRQYEGKKEWARGWVREHLGVVDGLLSD